MASKRTQDLKHQAYLLLQQRRLAESKIALRENLPH